MRVQRYASRGRRTAADHDDDDDAPGTGGRRRRRWRRQTETVGRPGGRVGRTFRVELRGRVAPSAHPEERGDAHEDAARAVRGRVRGGTGRDEISAHVIYFSFTFWDATSACSSAAGSLWSDSHRRRTYAIFARRTAADRIMQYYYYYYYYVSYLCGHRKKMLPTSVFFVCKTQAIKKIKFSLSQRTRFYFCRTTHKWFTEFFLCWSTYKHKRTVRLLFVYSVCVCREPSAQKRKVVSRSLCVGHSRPGNGLLVPPGRYIECVRQCSLQRSQCSIIPVHRVGVPVLATLSENKLLSTFIF